MARCKRFVLGSWPTGYRFSFVTAVGTWPCSTSLSAARAVVANKSKDDAQDAKRSAPGNNRWKFVSLREPFARHFPRDLRPVTIVDHSEKIFFMDCLLSVA